MVAVDQYTCNPRGRLPHTKGKEKEHEQYCKGTIFVDYASGYIYASNQISLNAAETIRSKHDFEREARLCGVEIKRYQGDNGVFRSTEFEADLKKRGQTIQFSGVGAHHQNAVAERAIRTVTESSRTMLLHAAIHWPEEVSMDLWPFAWNYALWIWNELPNVKSRMSPEENFCRTKQSNHVIRGARVWGCPAYVLDPTVQDGKKLPRWKPKARRGQFLGMSRRHASTIGLIRNLNTGSVTPQFHLVYDDLFTTLPSNIDPNQIEPPSNLDNLLMFSR
jgi:hypothetical protein